MGNELIFIGLITFQGAEFEITDGYYFNEGGNNKINQVIKDLHDLRMKLNKDNNPAQIVIKLLMNSIYGKTVTKPVETYTIAKDNKNDFETYISLHYNYIDSVIEVNSKFYIPKVKSIVSHFNYVQCGVEILGMSKRLMNNVFSCAYDLNIKMYYQDTDIIHVNYGDVYKVVERYKE